MTLTVLDAQLLFERLVDRIDKPIEYSRELSRLLADLIYTLASQNIVIFEGVPYFYDPVRGKTLSITRPVIRAAAYGLNIKDRYLSMDDVPSAGPQGFYIPRAATITGAWAKSRSTGVWTLDVRRNGAALTVASVSIIGSVGASDQLNIDVDEGDWIQVFAVGTGIEHPIAAVEIAWRKPD